MCVYSFLEEPLFFFKHCSLRNGKTLLTYSVDMELARDISPHRPLVCRLACSEQLAMVEAKIRKCCLLCLDNVILDFLERCEQVIENAYPDKQFAVTLLSCS